MPHSTLKDDSPKSDESAHAIAAIKRLSARIVRCERCPRLRKYCQIVAEEKKKAYRDWDYWGRPVPGFGDLRARLFIVGLAPAAHGANRTGRLFTGDRSGDWLYRALYRSGFANQPTSVHADDGLELHDAYIASSVRCAPPENKPLPQEFENCSEYLREELKLFTRVKVLIALGALGLGALERELRKTGAYEGRKIRFSHGGEHALPDGRIILTSYHPSQQNTFTGKLTDPMFQSIFDRARELMGDAES